MHLNLRITKCLQGIIKRKAVILVGLILLSLTSFKASAHSVQVGYVILPNGFIRVYIEHWHGDLSTAQLVGNGMSITTTYGTTTVTQNQNPTGAFNNTAWNNLPGAGANIIILATSSGSNRYNDWAYYDFAPAACNVPVSIRLNGGLTAVLIESESQIWPQTISGTFNDNAAPTITPSNTTTTVACGVTGANVNFSATALDNCTANPAVTFSVAPGSFFPVGTTPVTAYSSDANGNNAQLTFNVTVGVVDNIPPMIYCPAPISVGTDQVSCSAIVNYALPTYSDNCGVASIQQISGLPSGATFPKGNTTNTFRVTDGSGNTATCSFVVTVTDDVPPTALCKNVTVALNAGLTGSITLADINNGSYDNCGPVAVSISSGKTQFDCNDVGKSFPVTILVIDQQGLTNTCTAQVTVTDPNSYCNQPPVAVCKALTLSAGANCNATALAAAFDGGSTDADAGDVLTFSISPAGPYAIGTTSVTFTVTDSKGASSSCVTTVTVVDDEKPKANCKPVSVTLVNGSASITSADVNDNSTDNCGIASYSLSNSSFSCYNIGSNNIVTLTVTDIHGNVSSCNATVTVVGEIPSCSIASIPTSNIFTGGISTNLYLGYGAQSTTLKVTPAANGAPYTYSWISGPVNLLNSANSDAPVFTPTVAGSYTFTVETTNKYGCKTTCSITICVTDIRVPGTDGKKVYVCHVPPGNTGNPNTLSISVNAVSSHLGNHAGDRLGTCGQLPCTVVKATNSITQATQATQTTKELAEGTSEEELSVLVSPNPSPNFFTLKLTSRYTTPVSLKVMDATGRVVEAKSGIVANSTIQIGQNYTSGTFYAEMIQGTRRKVVQLIKVTR